VANCYDLSTKTYLFKLAKPDSKVFLVIESGVRIHSTTFSREHKDVPSVFTLKLRKAIRAKRLENVAQYGFDRVIDLTFGSGETAHHVICEFYAGGNIVLTDHTYKILALLRTYKSEDGEMNIAIGETYPSKPQQLLQLPSAHQLEEAVKAANANTVIRDIMAKQFVIGTEMIDHCLASIGVDGRLKAPQYSPEWTPKLIQAFSDTLSFAESPNSQKGFVVFTTAEDRAAIEKTKPQPKKKAKQGSTPASSETSASPSNVPVASTSVAPSAPKTATETQIVSLASIADRTDTLYENFVPFQFSQYAGQRFIEFSDFDSAVDEYFSKVEGQKVEAQRLEQEGSFVKRLDKVREDNQKRVQSLVDAEERARRMATLIEQNAEVVDAIIQTINGYIARQIDWNALADLVKQEKKKGNPLASMIHKLKLEQNAVVVLLYTPDDKYDESDDAAEEAESSDEEGEEGEEKLEKADAREVKEATAIEIDLSISAHKNSEKYFTATKKATDKKQKTMDAANLAMKRAEKKARSELKEVKLKASIQKLRSPYWFEKFNWFVTSEGFIVVSGRDAQQNELLYKRYLAKGDAYIHADVHGASTCIVKNPTGEPIPPRTLLEAGTLSVCHSAAWKNRVLTSAWWVEESQVSKTAPTGEYLSTGSFMIRGKKNLLPPAGLVMGFGILFRLADESIAAHVKETTDDEIRAEKDRKHAERDLQDQIKYGNALSSADYAEVSASTATEAATSSSDQFVDLGDSDESDGDDGDISTIAEDGSTVGGHSSAKQSADEHEEDEESSEEEDTETTPAESNTASAAPSQVDSKFALDLTQYSNVDEDEALLLAEETATSSQSDAQAGGAKKRLSKHERARLKKAEALGVEVTQLAKGPAPVKKVVAANAPQTQQKKKKIPKKYRHQDEEERAAAMELLGSAGKPKAEKPETAKATSASKGGKAKPGESTPGLKEKIEARQKAQAAQLLKDKEEEEIRLLMKEEKLEQLSETDLEKLRETSAKGLGVNLSALTGRPRPNDVLLYAMAVCAPYDALSDYKYKIKITPGTFKKGKSSKLAINAFLHQAESTERERELIKSIPDTELSMVIISNAKLQMPGLNAIRKK
jgi:predicted ribosome quality control (RQC) complex YloA/Tae2 family protein